MNPVRKLLQLGQSPWLDYIQRSLFNDGRFARMMAEDGICGLTSNPAILKKAIGHPEYAAAIARLRPRCQDALALYEALVLEDIRLAADALWPAYQESGGRDGYVSLEVSPDLAWDAEATVAEARRLWQAIDRPNAMIKVPATRPGLEAIRRLTALGINVNATLLFSPRRYVEVADAWYRGIRERMQRGLPVDGVASVASFFVSRIETLADRRLAEHPDRESAGALAGKVAVAAARTAYGHWLELAALPDWQALAEGGVQLQRLLWASTSTKNPAYSDVKYVDELVGPHTVNTLPPATLEAYRDHGNPAPRLRENLEQARRIMARFAGLGLDFDDLAAQLEEEGVEKFRDAWRQLMDTLERT